MRNILSALAVVAIAIACAIGPVAVFILLVMCGAVAAAAHDIQEGEKQRKRMQLLRALHDRP